MAGHSEAVLGLVEQTLTEHPLTVREVHARVGDVYAEGTIRNALAELANREKAHRTIEPNTTNHIRCRYRRP